MTPRRLDEDVATSLTSGGADFGVTQAWKPIGVRGTIRKSLFRCD